MISIAVQNEDFCHAKEYQKLVENDTSQGAVVTFTGRVRGVNKDHPKADKIFAIELESYPGMTEKALNNIATTARQRWKLGTITIIHRIGKLYAGEQIVFVGVTSRHRKAAFEACEFIIDTLKTEAPFWKKEFSKNDTTWVKSKSSDSREMEKWLKK